MLIIFYKLKRTSSVRPLFIEIIVKKILLAYLVDKFMIYVLKR